MSSGRAPVPTSLGRLLALPRFGSGTGLHRTEALVARLSAEPWWSRLQAFKVTGSKGKGSVATMAAAILTELGLPCGLYTSPHLFRFEERIRVDGEPISRRDLEAAASWVSRRCSEYRRRHPGEAIGAFEAFTVLAVRHFSRAGVKALVAEAGIGGRYDPTRLLPGPFVALTSVEAEHGDLLGASPELIAYDKADLCPEGGTLVLGQVEPELSRRLAAYCRLRRVELVPAGESVRVTSMDAGAGTMRLELAAGDLGLRGVEVGLLGRHQAVNAAVAVRLVWEWYRRRADADRRRFGEAVGRALVRLPLPGRFQRLQDRPAVYADVAHTPGATAAVAETVRAALPGEPILLLLGISHDKDAAGVVARLLPAVRAVVCTRPHHKGMALSALETLVRRERPDLPVLVAEPVETAMARAREIAAEQGMTLLVAGSLFLAAEVAEALAGRDPRALRFF